VWTRRSGATAAAQRRRPVPLTIPLGSPLLRLSERRIVEAAAADGARAGVVGASRCDAAAFAEAAAEATEAALAVATDELLLRLGRALLCTEGSLAALAEELRAGCHRAAAAEGGSLRATSPPSAACLPASACLTALRHLLSTFALLHGLAPQCPSEEEVAEASREAAAHALARRREEPLQRQPVFQCPEGAASSPAGGVGGGRRVGAADTGGSGSGSSPSGRLFASPPAAATPPLFRSIDGGALSAGSAAFAAGAALPEPGAAAHRLVPVHVHFPPGIDRSLYRSHFEPPRGEAAAESAFLSATEAGSGGLASPAPPSDAGAQSATFQAWQLLQLAAVEAVSDVFPLMRPVSSLAALKEEAVEARLQAAEELLRRLTAGARGLVAAVVRATRRAAKRGQGEEAQAGYAGLYAAAAALAKRARLALAVLAGDPLEDLLPPPAAQRPAPEAGAGHVGVTPQLSTGGDARSQAAAAGLPPATASPAAESHAAAATAAGAAPDASPLSVRPSDVLLSLRGRVFMPSRAAVAAAAASSSSGGGGAARGAANRAASGAFAASPARSPAAAGVSRGATGAAGGATDEDCSLIQAGLAVLPSHTLSLRRDVPYSAPHPMPTVLVLQKLALS
jgi:hypothetical protein